MATTEETMLARDGGKPAKVRPAPPMFPGGMMVGEEEKQAVLEVLDSKNLFRYYGPTPPGPTKTDQFEQEFSRHMGARYSLAVSSGTAALHTALVAAGIGPGDEVIVPAYTFIASAAAVLMAKAIPVIAEVDESLTLDPADLEIKVSPHTRAVMPVHMRGAPCRMDEILDIARRHHLKVIEDVAQADGGSYKGRRLGTLGDVGAFSLQFHKIITTGEGGMIVTDDQVSYERGCMFHDTGGAWRSTEFSVEPFLGTNYRMSELTAALGLVQLGRLEGLLAAMRERKRRIKEGIADLSEIRFRDIPDPDGDTGVCLIFYVADEGTAGEVAAALQAENISARSIYDASIPDWHIYSHWAPILQKTTPTPEGCPYTCGHYKGSIEYSPDMCPRTLAILKRAVLLNVSPLLTDEDVDQTITGIRKVVQVLLN